MPHTNTAALKTIHDKGGHFVLLREGAASDRRSKEPLPGTPWSRYWPSLEVLSEHRGRVGLVPSSIGATALDLDSGNGDSVLPVPWVSYKSRRHGGKHLWYEHNSRVKDSHWAARGCEGDLRNSGYLIPWGSGPGGGLARIAAAILAGRQLSLFPFPDELLAEILANSHLYVPERAARPHVWRDVASPLATVLPGLRYHALFAHLRRWSYPQAKGNSLPDWKRRVEDQAFSLNSQFPFPFKRAELRQVRDTAASVSSWTWDRLRRYSHTPEAQAARARRRWEIHRERTAGRDVAILEALGAGQRTLRDVASEYGLSVMGVRWILSRESLSRSGPGQ